LSYRGSQRHVPSKPHTDH